MGVLNANTESDEFELGGQDFGLSEFERSSDDGAPCENTRQTRRDVLKAELESQIVGLTIEYFGGHTPYQSEGTLGEYFYYFRSRNGNTTLRLMLNRHPDPDDPTYNILGEAYWSAEKDSNHETGNNSIVANFTTDEQFTVTEITTDEQFAALMLELFQKLERAPFNYEFSGNRVSFRSTDYGTAVPYVTGEDNLYHSSGHSAEEAYAGLFSFIDDLEKAGIRTENHRKIAKLQNVSPTALNEDSRVFPTTEPPLFGLMVPLF